MAEIKINRNDSGKACNSVIIGYNVSYGNDPQPLYEAGQAHISCVVELEAMAQISIQKAIFKDEQVTENLSVVNLAKVPSMTIDNAIIKYSYSASSGQAYVVENLTILGRKVQ
jgi:hypothetical protein